MNPSRSIARPLNECMPCLLMLRFVMLTLVAIITSTMLVLTGPPSRDPNSSGLAIPMTFTSAERPSDAEPAEAKSPCDPAQAGSTVLGLADSDLKGESVSYDFWDSDRPAASPCPVTSVAGGSGLGVEPTGFDRRLPTLLTPRAIFGVSE